MAPSSQTSSKRMRTGSDGSQRPLDPSEELSQVAGLVERRRLQNKISQRNYREWNTTTVLKASHSFICLGNRIRDRLEALEALVDNTSKGQGATNGSKASANARTTKPAGVKRKLEEGAQGSSRQSPQNPSAVLPSETSNSWNMGDFLDTSATQFDSIYDFPAPQSPVSPQAFPDHVSTRECSPSNHPSSNMTSIDVTSKPPTTVGLELDGATENPRAMDGVAPHVTTGSMSPHSTGSQSVPFNPIYGCPMTPMSLPMQPMTPGSLPRKSIQNATDQPIFTISPAQLDRHDTNNDHVPQPGAYPFPSAVHSIPSSMQSAGYLQPQQFVWVPVPIMSLPQAQPPLHPTAMGRPPFCRPEALSAEDPMARRC
ncbi:MAG: hypothetical protein Q9216_000648 [Gyalolechia sp. 2 TL-2023]